MKSIFLFFSLLPFLAFCQNETVLGGIVRDGAGMPLPYVNIGIVGTAFGTVSGVDGTFKLYLPASVPAESSLRFSMVGHEGRSFPLGLFLEEFGETANVALSQTATVLTEVVVRPRFTNRKQIGMERPGTRRSVNFAISGQPNQNLGAEIGRKFRLPGKEAVLDTFRFFVSRNNFDTVRFRVNVYELEKGKPGANLLRENVLVELVNRQNGWVKVDLTPYNLLFQENVVVSVEWIFHGEKGKLLALPIALPSAGTHFYKYGSHGHWKKFAGMSSAMSLDVSYQ